MCKSRIICTLMALCAFPLAAASQQGDGTDVSISTHVFKPELVAATPERIAALKVPGDFTVRPFATGLKNARIIAVSDEGFIYVSRRDQGDIILLKDANGDGVADEPAQVVANQPGAHGLALKGHQFFLVTVKEVYAAEIKSDGTLGPLQRIIKDLPDAGQHANRTIAVGPDGMLYISVGSTCNACNESGQESATILRASTDGKDRSIFASGLRNTIGFDWHPQTGELWGFDNGIDFLGDTVQPEELNRIEA
jgi:glucose/arabinose dehydrogenase